MLAAAAYVAFSAVRSAPGLTASAATRHPAFPGRPHGLGWPAQGQAAAGVEGVGLIGSHGPAGPTPIASLAKVMTAYVVLHDHPLNGHASGPSITVHPSDVAVYRSDVASGQSVVAVRAGEHLTERQALEGLLLPSGNNIATLLARWDAGSLPAFVARMNATARRLDLRHTHYADASGYRAATVSTATDQVRLAILAMAQPAFRQTVGMTQATLPVAGQQFNLDGLLGTDGIIGIKTGTTPQAGGCFLYAARARVGGHSVILVGGLLHQMATRTQPSILAAALHATTALVNGSRRALETHRIIRRGEPLAAVTAPWGPSVPLTAAHSVVLSGWPGLRTQVTVSVHPRLTAPVRAGQTLGSAVVTAGSEHATVPLVASGSLSGPPLGWKLTHP